MKSKKIERGLPESYVIWMLTSQLTSPSSSLLFILVSLPFSSQLETRELQTKENPSAKCIISLNRINAAQLISFTNWINILCLNFW